MIALLDTVILDVSPCLSWLGILLSSPFFPIRSLLRNQLTVLWEPLCRVSSKFSICCSSSSPSGTPMIWMLERLRMSWRFLSLSSFFSILVSSFCFGWMFIFFFCSKSLIWVLISFPSLLVPCTFSFISLYIVFTSFSILWLYSTISMSILITSVLNSPYEMMALSSSLSHIFGTMICWFIWATFPCLHTPVA